MKLKIAIVLQGFPQLSETFIIYHIKGLIELGHDVTCFSTFQVESKFHHPLIKENNILRYAVFNPPMPNGFRRIVRLFIILIKNLRSHFCLVRTLNPFLYGLYGLKGYLFFDMIPFLVNENKHFDIINTHFGENGKKVVIAKKLKLINGNHILTFHGHDIARDDLLKANNHYKSVFKDLRGIVFNSFYLKDLFDQKFMDINIPFKIIYAPTDTKVFNFSNLRNNSNLQYNLITVGRLISWKGQMQVVNALKIIHEKYPHIPFHYHIVGDGEEFENLKNKIELYKLSDFITLHGAKTQNDVKRLLDKSDVFILFGIKDLNGEVDTQGVVLQEAGSTGLPVIVSTAGGLKESVIDNYTGLVIDVGSIDKLCEGIIFFFTNPELRVIYGQNGAEFVKTRYDYRNISCQYIDFYSFIISNG